MNENEMERAKWQAAAWEMKRRKSIRRLYGWMMFLGLALFLFGFWGGVEVGVGVTDPAWAMAIIPGGIGAVVGACGLLEGVEG